MGHVLSELCRRRVCLPASAARALCERNARENRRKEGEGQAEIGRLQKSAAGRWTTATARHLPCSARQGDGEHWTVARSVDRDGRR